MILTSWGAFGKGLGALLGRLGGLLGRLEAVLGVLGRSLGDSSVLEASWRPLGALLAHLGANRWYFSKGLWPREGGRCMQGSAFRRGGGPLEDLQKPYQTSTWHSSTPQRARGHGGR